MKRSIVEFTDSERWRGDAGVEKKGRRRYVRRAPKEWQCEIETMRGRQIAEKVA